MREFTNLVLPGPRNLPGCDVRHRILGRDLRKMIEPLSTSALFEGDADYRAQAAAKRRKKCSPRRKPWVSTARANEPRRGERHVSHTSGNILLHMIFSTQSRRPLIEPDFRDDLFAYLGGIIREMDGTGGDHQRHHGSRSYTGAEFGPLNLLRRSRGW